MISNSASFPQSLENLTSSPVGFIQRPLASFRTIPELPKQELRHKFNQVGIIIIIILLKSNGNKNKIISLIINFSGSEKEYFLYSDQ